MDEEIIKIRKKYAKCQCCKRRIEKIGGKKFCNRCSIYLSDLKRKVPYYKRKSRKLNKILYGVENGIERIRFKEQVK